MISVLLAVAAFSGNPCGLVTAKQVAALGVPTQCKSSTLKGMGPSSSSATWAGTITATSPHLSISITTYQSTSSPFWKLGLQALDKRPGQARKVSGIGSVAYESGGDGSTLSALNFVVGKQIVDINMRTAKPPKSLAALEAIAKTVAKAL